MTSFRVTKNRARPSTFTYFHCAIDMFAGQIDIITRVELTTRSSYVYANAAYFLLLLERSANKKKMYCQLITHAAYEVRFRSDPTHVWFSNNNARPVVLWGLGFVCGSASQIGRIQISRFFKQVGNIRETQKSVLSPVRT